MASNKEFYNKVITPLLSQFCICKVEKKAIKFFGMSIVQAQDFTMSVSQDTKSTKDLPAMVLVRREEGRTTKTISRSVALFRSDATQSDINDH